MKTSETLRAEWLERAQYQANRRWFMDLVTQLQGVQL